MSSKVSVQRSVVQPKTEADVDKRVTCQPQSILWIVGPYEPGSKFLMRGLERDHIGSLEKGY